MSLTPASNMHRADPRPILPDVLVQMDEQHAYIREVEDNLRGLIATVGDEPSDRELTEVVLSPYSIGTKTLSISQTEERCWPQTRNIRLRLSEWDRVPAGFDSTSRSTLTLGRDGCPICHVAGNNGQQRRREVKIAGRELLPRNHGSFCFCTEPRAMIRFMLAPDESLSHGSPHVAREQL